MDLTRPNTRALPCGCWHKPGPYIFLWAKSNAILMDSNSHSPWGGSTRRGVGEVVCAVGRALAAAHPAALTRVSA